ncbi:uncharacterized protein LOC128863943 [Anastrepha ludens]|uniref:uncharacterized protein LOC128863943 n=1 Tax=Anastrepha ludens TaxID=28586 RepID=UPI0023AF3BBB|nr:uncharacterized protein LOC128863943 [Anastrepha ludens]
MQFGIYALIIFGLFYFSEGKPCPEKTRPHKTRCEAYYKCIELPSKRYVWVPEKCESGLIYEHNLGLCVLPDDDWECILGVSTHDGKVEDNERNKAAVLGQGQTQTTKTTQMNVMRDADLYIINNKDGTITDADSMTTLKNGANENDMEVIIDSSVGSEEEVEHDDSLIESSGDGVGELMELDGFLRAENRETEEHHEGQLIENDENDIKPDTATKKSKIDPKLTAHLQRLSQLIDGLKDQYQQGEKEQTELRPDQLNAFLAHFNIQNKFNLIKPTFEKNSKETADTTTTTAPAESTMAYAKYQIPSKNKTRLQEHLDNKLKPETKVVLTNTLPKHYGTTGYSNSQIVVNRPEGSVLFTLPHYGNQQTSEYGHNTPKISEDTLKTVLELSKQMIATQNIPKIIPNTGYYAQPLIQPLFLPASAFQTQAQANPFAAYFNSVNNNKPQEDYDANGGKFGPFTDSYHNPSGHNQLLRPAGSYNKPANTIIHNNVIPIHLTSTNSGEKEIVDSYGQSLGIYPPLNSAESNGYHQQFHTNSFGDNKFLISHTTTRPQISTTPSPTGYAAQYPSPFPTELGATTIRPIHFEPTSPTLTEYFSPSPHLNDNNVNKLFQSTDRYPTVQYDDLPRPMSLGRPSLFSPQMDKHKVKVRPNGHTIESMEVEADDYNDNQARPLPQLFTYNYDNDKPDMSNQYQELVYGGHSGGNKHAYMPRPSAGVGSTRPSYTIGANKLKPYNTHSSSSFADGTQLINMGGNFISYDAFQNTILPLLGQSQSLSDLNNVEVITCATGVRQPNTTDCTRYYVCSKKDGKVLSYSCPPYTAFNAQSRICDAHTYAVCSPDAIISSYTVSENKRLQMEALKAWQDAKRRQEQAIKAENIANLIQKYGGQTQAANEDGAHEDSSEKNMLNAYVQQAAAMKVYSTTAKPTSAPVKKRKYYCKEGDKIADQTSMSSYFICYKNAQGMMKGHKMTCTKGLIFCTKSAMCTLPNRCT